MLALCGLIVGVTLRYLPGTGGHNPADGFAMGGDFTAKDLPSVLVASLATLILGGVLRPEMPLVVVGMVVATTIVRLIKKDAPKQAVVVIGAAGSFAAISTLLGSPVVGAFLLLEAAGVGGGLISVILLPGLVAAGVGALVFVALSHATGTGVATLAVPHLPAIGYPTGSQFGWAIGIGLLAAPAGTAIRRLAFQIQPFVARHKVLVTPVAGLAIGGLAVLFAEEQEKARTSSCSPANRTSPPSSSTRQPGRPEPWSCSSSAKGSPSAYPWAASKVARPSPACFSAPRSASPCPTFPACPWSTAWPWESGR